MPKVSGINLRNLVKSKVCHDFPTPHEMPVQCFRLSFVDIILTEPFTPTSVIISVYLLHKIWGW